MWKKTKVLSKSSPLLNTLLLVLRCLAGSAPNKERGENEFECRKKQKHKK
jgi:hypothetical protein